MEHRDPLSPAALRTLTRFGDILLPGGHGFPKFSETGCIERVNAMAIYADPGDMRLFNLAMCAFSVLPTFALRWLCGAMLNADRSPAFVAGIFRMLNISIRAFTITPYFADHTGPGYRGPSIHDVMDYRIRCGR